MTHVRTRWSGDRERKCTERTARYRKLKECAATTGRKICREKRYRERGERGTGILEEHGGLGTPFLTSTVDTIQYNYCTVRRVMGVSDHIMITELQSN
jgi:hypothetical protein